MAHRITIRPEDWQEVPPERQARYRDAAAEKGYEIETDETAMQRDVILVNGWPRVHEGGTVAGPLWEHLLRQVLHFD